MEHPTSTASQPTSSHLQSAITTSTPFIIRTQLIYASPQSTTPSQTTSCLHRHHLSTASPSSTSISTTTRPFQQQICLPAPAQDIPTCFPRRDTIALFCLSTIPLASESPVSPFYDTQHLFTSKGAYFPRLWLFFPFFSVDSFVLAIVFTGALLLEEHLLEG